MESHDFFWNPNRLESQKNLEPFFWNPLDYFWNPTDDFWNPLRDYVNFLESYFYSVIFDGYENCTLLLGEENINHIIFLVSETSFCLQTRAKYPCIHKKVSRYKIKKLVKSMIGLKKKKHLAECVSRIESPV